jgi:hypothetical protein
MSKNEEYVYDIAVDSSREAESGGNRQAERDLLKMKMTQKITAVNADGSYSLEMLVEPQKLTKNNQDVPLDPMQQKVTMRMSKSGEILETSLQGPATQPSFPTRPIFIGETWEGESKVNLQDPTTGQPLPPVTLKFIYTLSAISKIKGYDCAHIMVKNPESEITLSQGVTQKISAKGDTYFAHKEGRLIKSDVQTEILMTLPDGKLHNTIQITVEIVETPRSLSQGNNEFLISG